MGEKAIDLTVQVWRQRGPAQPGRFETHEVHAVSTDLSFLELLDHINEGLEREGREPIAFEHDCREGICGSCGLVINGRAHGPERGTATCQLHLRAFKSGDTITVEPWRARAFPVIKDLVVDRSCLDAIVQVGGYVSVNTGSAPDAHTVLIRKSDSDAAFDAAACIGCGACVAACPNAAAMLFVGAKIEHLARLPQGAPERRRRALRMVQAMDGAGFGNCTNVLECSAACPKEIPGRVISVLNREFFRASLSDVDRAGLPPPSDA